MTTPNRFNWYWPAQAIKQLRAEGHVAETLRDDCQYRTGDYVTLHEYKNGLLTGHWVETYITKVAASCKPHIVSIELEEVK